MSRVKWDAPADKEYRTGVSHGVLYVKAATGETQEGDAGYLAGVAWVGLTAVNQAPSGAEATPLYADNDKYLNLVSNEDFAFTIEAYTYPDEFAVCNGEQEVMTTGSSPAGTGMYITAQPRREFAFCYRTEVGDGNNVALDTNADYELHIVYNCTAAPSDEGYSTINDSPDAITMSWEVNTVPMAVTGYAKKTAHIRIRKTSANATKVETLENSLYGTDGQGSTTGTNAKMLTPAEIIAIMTAA